MNSPLEETIVGDLFRTSLIGTGFVSAVCARTIVGHTKAQTTASIIALFIVSILVHNLDAQWSSVTRVPSTGTGNYPSKQTLPSPLAMERSNSSILSAAPFIPLPGHRRPVGPRLDQAANMSEMVSDLTRSEATFSSRL